MESFRDDDRLAEALAALRPAPSIAFAADLDERVAAGFPRRPDSAGTLGRFTARLREMKPRQLLLPSAAAATVAIVVATVVVANYDGPPPNVDGTAGGQVRPTRAASSPDSAGFLGARDGASKETGSAGGVGGASAPNSSAAEAGAGSPAAAEVEAVSPSGVQATADSHVVTPLSASNASLKHRDVERSTAMVLGTDPEGVADATAQVFAAVHAAHGVVLRSSSTNGSTGKAGAQFDLLIPSGRLDDALAAFSGIAEVRSRHDGTVDITAPTVGAGERLQDSQARIDGLLNELAGSETEAEREAIEAQLGSERRKSARLSVQLDALQKRASLSRVSLRIVADGSSGGTGGGSWDAGDAIGDAGHILAIAAGVTIVGLAVLGPIALLALLLWLANRAWVRRGRERVLD